MDIQALLRTAPSVDEARRILLEAITPLAEETMPARQALGRCVRRSVPARLNLPGWAKSGMDGYALRAADSAGASAATPRRLPIAGTVTAGGAAIATVPPGSCARVMTGGLLPDDLDCVVPLEDARRDGENLVLERPLSPGTYVRAAGSEVGAGSVLAPACHELTAERLELLSSQGILEVVVGTRPRVAIFSTGDELIDPDAPGAPSALPRGSIYCSNNHYFGALAESAGGLPWLLGTAVDERAVIAARLGEAMSAEVVLITGGTGLGDKDLAAPVMKECGLDLLFKNVRMRPGTFIAVGRRGATLVFSLSGYANAAAITYELLVRPALRALQGFAPQPAVELEAVLDCDLRARPGLPTYLRGVLSWRPGGWHADRWKSGHPGAAPLVNALIVMPPERTQMRAGEKVTAILTHPERAVFQ
ncbi:MAG: molybdopterin molybdotransferase MoeA [Candidatus Tectomicrobia bacterium]|nr:molybdopterin molybdotransferase MoeA [Candidatus Tectomicrobia bacterium]